MDEDPHKFVKNLFPKFAISNTYNEHIVPPDLILARKHKRANAFEPAISTCSESKEQVLDDVTRSQRCECCMKHLNRNRVESCTCSFDIDHRISQFGSGYPLYLYI